MSEAGSSVRRRPIDPRLLRYSTAARTHLALTAVVVLAQAAAIVAFSWLLARAVVAAIEGDGVTVATAAIAAAVVVLARGLLVAASDAAGSAGAARASLQLRERVVAAMTRLGPGWSAAHNSAALAVTAGHGLESLDAYFGKYLPQLLATAIATPVIVVAVWIADPLSGVILVLTLPLIPVFMVLIGWATGALQSRQFRMLQRLATRFADTVAGMGTLKIFGRDRRAARSIGEVTGEYATRTIAVLRVSFLSGFALEFLAALSVAVVAVTIGFRLLAGELPLVVGLFVLLLAPEAFLPLRQVGAQFHAAAEGVAATEDIFAVLDGAVDRPEAESPVAGTRPPSRADLIGSCLAARGVAVMRGDQRIGPVDLDLRAGEILLLHGPSGCGKTTLIAALLGFVPHDGVVFVDGVPASHARDAIAWSGQHPGLQAGTVAQNVALGRKRIDTRLVTECLQDAALDPAVIDASAMVGAGGMGLSGGQAQRVALARALYRMRSRTAGTPILVLDEPSSALDSDTEAVVWRMLRARADGGAAILLVSHRPSARAIADRVLEMPRPQPCAPTVADSR